MNKPKMILALALVALLGAQSGFAVTTDIVRKDSGVVTDVGQIQYAMTYTENTAKTATVTKPTVETISQTKTSLGATITGIDVKDADAINAYLVSQNVAGDTAVVMAAIGNSIADTKTAAVTNYCMYGYVTADFAWAGQYADKITGNSVDLEAHSFNKATGPLGAQLVQPAAGPATLPSYVGAAFPVGGEYASTNGYIASGAATGEKYTLSTVYQTAMAGGSGSSTWPNGMWAMVNVAKNAKNSVLMGPERFAYGLMGDGLMGDGLTLINDAYYSNGAGNYIGTDRMGIPNIVDLTATPGTTGTATTNSDSMGYANKTIGYTNWDTAISSSGPSGTTATVEYGSSSAQKGLTTLGATTSSIGPAYQTFSGSKNLFLYSLVNSANPSGISPVIFY
jgi:hypothetical protein